MNAINVWATMALWYHSKHQIKVMWASFYPERVIQRGTVIKMWCDWTIKILTKLDLTHLKCRHISYRVYHIEIDETKWLPEVWKFEFHQPVFKNVTLADLIPQQPPTERVSDISKKSNFRWSIPQKRAGFDHMGARDDPIISISILFWWNETVERPLRLLRL